jgi:hypothetical protein
VKVYTTAEESNELLKDIRIKLVSNSEKMNSLAQDFNKSLYELEAKSNHNELLPIKPKPKLKISNSMKPVTVVSLNSARPGYYTARPGTSIPEAKRSIRSPRSTCNM